MSQTVRQLILGFCLIGDAVVSWGKAIAPLINRYKGMGVALLALFFLSGCVHYDVGINFAGQTHGEIVQHIRLGEQLTNFSGTVTKEWLKSIDRRTRQLGGWTRHPSSEEVIVTIPFNNGADLEAKFNQFFNAAQSDSQSVKDTALDLPDLESHLKVSESNLLLLLRNRLSYDLDLRSLGVLSANGNLLVSPGTLLDLEFSLTTPWGARAISKAGGLSPAVRQQGNQLTWTLTAGEVNHLEAVFWLPSPLGIGTIVIVLFVAAGAYLKSQLSPSVETGQVETGLRRSPGLK